MRSASISCTSPTRQEHGVRRECHGAAYGQRANANRCAHKWARAGASRRFGTRCAGPARGVERTRRRILQLCAARVLSTPPPANQPLHRPANQPLHRPANQPPPASQPLAGRTAGQHERDRRHPLPSLPGKMDKKSRSPVPGHRDRLGTQRKQIGSPPGSQRREPIILKRGTARPDGRKNYSSLRERVIRS